MGDILTIIFKSLCLAIGSITLTFFLLSQLFQTLPRKNFNFKTSDYVLFLITGFLLVLGAGDYWPSLAIPLMMTAKALAFWRINPSKIVNSGRWVEVEWSKQLPKGYPPHLQAQMSSQLQQIPGDKHIILPFLAAKLALRFVEKKVKKEMNKPNANMQIPKGQEQIIADKTKEIINKVKSLKTNHSEKLQLGVGVLKVTRL